MQEDFLHYIWKHKLFSTPNLSTTNGEPIVIKCLGQHNFNSGPDFFNAQLKIGDQLWAGNVEIHLKSSDWYHHKHQVDDAYNNVILHVVWQHDSEIFRKNNTVIPTLELNEIVDKKLSLNYQKLMYSKSWINCERDFHSVDGFHLDNWIERLYIERLERKSVRIIELLKKSNNDWEAVLFKMLLKNFGLKVNAEAFLSIAKSVDYSIIRKIQTSRIEMEALLFGQAGLLDHEIQEVYYSDLKQHYQFLRQKFKLNNIGIAPLQFFRLRPANFPTIRLSQFAMLYAKEQKLFSKIVSLNSKEAFYELFKVRVSEFWETHYTFESLSKKSSRVLSKAFIDLLIINTIIPIKFCYAIQQGKNIEDQLLQLVSEINLETNSIVKKYLALKPLDKNALTSQALLQLHEYYCNKNKCLQCVIGNSLIVKN